MNTQPGEFNLRSSAKNAALGILRSTQGDVLTSHGTDVYRPLGSGGSDYILEPLEIRRLASVDLSSVALQRPTEAGASSKYFSAWQPNTAYFGDVDDAIIAIARSRLSAEPNIDIEEDIEPVLPLTQHNWIRVQVRDLGRAHPPALLDPFDEGTTSGE